MSTKTVICHIGVALAVPLFTGCAMPVEPTEREEDTPGTASEPIVSGNLVISGTAIERSTVGIVVGGNTGCTGTIIAPRLVLTAAHCFKTHAGAKVHFYTGGINRSRGDNPTIPAIKVNRVFFPDGINMDDGDCTATSNSCDDVDGRLADIVVLQLATAVPSPFVPAVLATQSSDPDTVNGKSVLAVGAGNHDGNIAAATQMRFRSTTILDVNPSFASSDSVLWAADDVTDGGDSGGPLYAFTSTGALKVVGVLRGTWWRVASAAMRSRYTAVRDHSAWISQFVNGTFPWTHIVDITHDACGGNLQFIDTDFQLHTFPPGNNTPQTFDVFGPDVTWTCDGSLERTGCPDGTDAVRVFREAGEPRRFTVECRQHNWSI